MPPRKSSIAVSSRADSAKTDNTVLARRLKGNLQGGGNRTIPLKEPQRWYTRIENNQADEQRFYHMVHELGYLPVKPEDLACEPAQIGFRVSEDGNLVRGGGTLVEMLFKMPVEDRALLDQAFTQANMRGIGSASKIKRDMAEATAASHGDEAANYVNSLDGEVSDQIVG